MNGTTSQPTGNWLLVQAFVQTNIKDNTNAAYHWPFVKRIHRLPVDSHPQEKPAMRKAFPCHDKINDSKRI